MYLYGSEHALMDFHLNEDKRKKVEEPKQEETKEPNGTDTDSTE